jgi:hypothetical protein
MLYHSLCSTSGHTQAGLGFDRPQGSYIFLVDYEFAFLVSQVTSSYVMMSSNDILQTFYVFK